MQHLFHQFRELTKVCMFGDPKQRMDSLAYVYLSSLLTTLPLRSAPIWEGDRTKNEDGV